VCVCVSVCVSVSVSGKVDRKPERGRGGNQDTHTRTYNLVLGVLLHEKEDDMGGAAVVVVCECV
jgi:hypothetical protein